MSPSFIDDVNKMLADRFRRGEYPFLPSESFAACRCVVWALSLGRTSGTDQRFEERALLRLFPTKTKLERSQS